MKSKIGSIVLAASLFIPIGCATATAPTPPLAPGYSSSADQSIGQGLKALHDFVNQATTDYPKLTPLQQAQEKSALNALITATNLADSTYTSFHAGTATLAQAQASLNSANTAQNSFLGVAK